MLPKLTLADLGGCHNDNCLLDRACGKEFKFIPGDDLKSDFTAQELLSLKCLCGCYALYHYQNKAAPQADPNKTDQPSGPPPPTNSTTETPSPTAGTAPPSGTSRPRPFAFSHSASANGPSFAGVASARARKQQENNRMKEDLKKNGFSAASKLHENSMKNATGARKKKGTQPNVAQAPAKSIPQRALKVKRPRESIVKFTIVLVDDTAAAHARKFFMPSIGRLRTYFRLGLVKQTELRSQATPDELQSLIVSLFSDISILVQSCLKLDDGYVLLMREEEQKKEAKGKKLHGQRGRFTPVERTGPYTFFHFETAREKLGKPTQWGNTIFIALAKHYSNIKIVEDDSSAEEQPLDGFESDSTLSSSVSLKDGGDNNEELPEIGSKKWRQKTFSDTADLESDADSKAENVDLGASHFGDEASILEQMPYSFIPNLFNLSVNLTDPNETAVPESPEKEKARTWFMLPTGNLRTHYNALQYVVEALKKSARRFEESSPSKWGTNSQWDFNKFLADAHRQIQHNFEFIIATRSLLPDEEQYWKALYLTIRFGPRGLTPLITLLHSLHTTLSNAVKAGVILHLRIVEAVSYLDYFGDVLYHIVCDVRMLTLRMHIDPSGLAELEYALSHPDVGKCFKIAETPLRVLSLFIDVNSASDFKNALEEDFGAFRDPNTINKALIKLGYQGLGGFVRNTFISLVDRTTLIEASTYNDLFNIFSTFGKAVSTAMLMEIRYHTMKRTSDSWSSDEGENMAKKGRSLSPSNIYDWEPTSTEKECFERRPKFPYPQAQTVREKLQPSPSPPAPAPTHCRPKPQPLSLESLTRRKMQELERKIALMDDEQALKTVVEGYIHPDFRRRKQWSDYRGQSIRSIYKQILSQIFHPDKASTVSLKQLGLSDDDVTQWQIISSEITKMINAKMSLVGVSGI